MANNPELLKMPLARDGQKSTIPETTDASTGLFSQQYGWQSINSLPPQAGGKAVKREDFNGAFNLLGGIAFMAQKGFTFKWSAEQDYYAGCVVIDDTDGLRYECIADVTANDTAPSADATHWQIFSAGTDLDAWFRQPGTAYAVGDMRCYESLPYGWYLECTTEGITGSGDITIPSPLNAGDTVTDGAVTWTIRKIGSGGDGVPLGAMLPFGGNGELPSGYLLCDGAAYSRAMFPDLFSVIGTTYGAGDGSTTFNVPDYNTAKRFAQGDTVAGQVKQAGLPNITGYVGSPYCNSGTVPADGAFYTTTDNGGAVGGGNTYTKVYLDASRSSSVYGNSDTVQPNALTVRYIIKAFDGQTADSALIDITQYAQALANTQLPTGTIIPTANDVASPGFLICDGSAVSRETYSKLFSAIGTKYGAGDGNSTFNLPNSNFAVEIQNKYAPLLYANPSDPEYADILTAVNASVSPTRGTGIASGDGAYSGIHVHFLSVNGQVPSGNNLVFTVANNSSISVKNQIKYS